MHRSDGHTLIQRAEDLYNSLGLANLERQGIVRDHSRHYGMVIYPSIRSSHPIEPSAIFGGTLPGTARLYIHIPFCTGRCTFCHFQLASKSRYGQRYLEHLGREIELLSIATPDISFHGTFMGGGTPSQLTSRELEDVLGHVQSSLSPESTGFNTIEVHPEFVRETDALLRLQQMREAGFNRISIGVQAFEQTILDRLNRRHTIDENYTIIKMARDAGFQYIDVDIMYGLPGQGLGDWAHTLSEVSASDVDSASIFYLIWRDNTPMGHRAQVERAALPSHRESTLMRIMASEAFQNAGFVESLTDHFHRAYPDRARHPQGPELIYSKFFVLPVGISGWGYANQHHYWNTFDTEEYFKLIDKGILPITRGIALDEDERTRRDMMFCLKYGRLPFAPFRTRDGIEVSEQYRHVIEPLVALGLIQLRDDGADLTYTGRLFMEETCSFFFSDAVWRDIYCTPSAGQPTHSVASGRKLTVTDESRILETFHYLITPRRASPERVLAVVAHPDPASLTHSLFNAFRSGAELGGHTVRTLDLFAEEDLGGLGNADYRSDARSGIPRAHQDLIAESSLIAFFYPIWWYAAPARLRMWYELTFTRGFAFDFSLDERYRGLLTDKRVVVVNTAADSAEGFDRSWGDAYLQGQVHAVFGTLGITQRCVRVFLNVHHAPETERTRMIAEASFLGRHLDLPALFDRSAAPQEVSLYRRCSAATSPDTLATTVSDLSLLELA